MGYFDELISKQGETISRYVHSFETSRDSTTNLKVSKWAAAVNVTAVIRSQPAFIDEREEGVHKLEAITVLTKTALAKWDIVKWQDKYFDVVMVEPVYWGSTLQYYKCACQERVEFLGS